MTAPSPPPLLDFAILKNVSLPCCGVVLFQPCVSQLKSSLLLQSANADVDSISYVDTSIYTAAVCDELANSQRSV